MVRFVRGLVFLVSSKRYTYTISRHSLVICLDFRTLLWSPKWTSWSRMRNAAHFDCNVFDCWEWRMLRRFDVVVVVKLHQSGTHFTSASPRMNLSHTRSTTKAKLFRGCVFRVRNESQEKSPRQTNIKFFFFSAVFFFFRCQTNSLTRLFMHSFCASHSPCPRRLLFFRATFRIVSKPFSILMRSLNSF